MDVNSRPLALTSENDGELAREYPLPQAAPAVGYYSLRYGTAGVEEAFDAYLRGESDDFWSNLWQEEILGESKTGRDLRLTIDARWQEQAQTLLGDGSGAVLLFSVPDVAIRAMASSPGYDPNSLDADFEQLTVDERAPLLNRVTQGQYQPGLLLQPFLLAVAASQGELALNEPVSGADDAVVVDGVRLACQSIDDEAGLTWAGALAGKCPGPTLALGRQLGEEWLLTALEAFGFTSQSDLLTTPEDAQPIRIDDVGLAAVGQDILAISPLQVGEALAALANEGQLRPAQLLAASQDEQGAWMAARPEVDSERVVPARVTEAILDAFDQEEGIRERSVMVLSGPEGEFNSWYLGLAPAAEPRYGVVVVVEGEQGPAASREIGRALLKSALDPSSS